MVKYFYEVNITMKIGKTAYIRVGRQMLLKVVDDKKICSTCLQYKVFSSFKKVKNGYFGLSSQCLGCFYKKYRVDNLVAVMWARAKVRAGEKGLLFTITKKDIVVPTHCPILGVELVPFSGSYSPSLDRMDSSKGYIPGNVWVISNRANTLKSDSTAHERLLVYEKCKHLP